jgi:hypothetical protein
VNRYLVRNATDMVIGMAFGLVVVLTAAGVAGGLLYLIANWPNR